MEGEDKSKAEKELKELRDAYREERSHENFGKLFAHLLDTRYLYVPVSLEMSEADREKFANASLGDIVQTTEPMRAKPDFLRSDDGLFLPIFSSVDEAPDDYANQFSWINLTLKDCIALKNRNVTGLVIDAFTKPVQIDGVEMEMMERLISTDIQMDEDERTAEESDGDVESDKQAKSKKEEDE